MILLLSTSTPEPFDANLVTPGVVGFFAILAVAVAAVLLILDMSRRVRRVRYREEIRERIATEQAEMSDGRSDTAPGPDEDESPRV